MGTSRQPIVVPPPPMPLGMDDFFWYLINPVQLTASQVGVQTSVQIDEDTDFIWYATASTQTGLYSVTLHDGLNDRPFMDTPINGENFAGTAQLPFMFEKGYRIDRSTTLLAVFNDRSGAANVIQVALGGYKIP
jgi:hypothetical protein